MLNPPSPTQQLGGVGIVGVLEEDEYASGGEGADLPPPHDSQHTHQVKGGGVMLSRDRLFIFYTNWPISLRGATMLFLREKIIFRSVARVIR